MKALADGPDKPWLARSQDRPGPGLHVVATPIGNRGDMTLRALAVLAGVDRVLCEDTRTTGALLSYYGIETNLTAYHEHNAAQRRPELLARLAAGATLALASDAGTPLINDPGYRLVAAARAAGIPVHAVPGPSALTAALSVAGLPTDRIHFAGFPPAKASQRRRFLGELAAVPATLVLYEAPHRLAPCLADLAGALGDGRDAAVLRELTKQFETCQAGSLAELAAAYGAAGPRGECVVVVAPPESTDPGAPAEDGDLVALIDSCLPSRGTKALAARLARLTGYPRKGLYDLILARQAETEA